MQKAVGEFTYVPACRHGGIQTTRTGSHIPSTLEKIRINDPHSFPARLLGSILPLAKVRSRPGLKQEAK